MRTLVAVVVAALVGDHAMALDIPLTVRETQNVARTQNPVNSGVPLPKGAVKDAARMCVADAAGKFVMASVEPRARWVEDGSLKWVTVHFLADLPANGTATYHLAATPTGLSATPLRVVEADKAITVFTGPAKFVIPTDRLAPFEQVYVRPDTPDDFAAGGAYEQHFKDAEGLLARSARVVLVARNGESRVVNKKAEVVSVGDAFEQTGTVTSAAVEERGMGRVVVALKGTFSTNSDPSLDFTARLYFYAFSPLVQMTLSVRNRQLDSMARFVGIQRLAVEVPLKTAGQGAVTLSKDGQAAESPLGPKPVRLLQTAYNKMALTTGDGATAEGKQSDGWVRLASDAATLTAGNRWFWQTYPKGLTVEPNGLVALELKPPEGRRVDLYTAGAKTHFLFFHFARGAAPAAESLAAGTTHPLVAQCAPDWYCQGTRVFGDLYSKHADNFQPEYRDLIARYQANVDRSIRQIAGQRGRENWPTTVDEYGWLDFGSGLHHRDYVGKTSADSWWDGNYYDFPHAAIINYVRTGDLINLTTAEEAGLHLSDIDICHSFPGDPKQAGAPRSGPVIGHFRNYAGDTNFMGHNSFTFYKNESLYELYYLTGERWYHDVGLMSSDFAMARWGQGALRNVAHGIWGVLSAYHDTHQRKYLDRARFFVDQWAKPWQDKNSGSFNDQIWMYGLQFEAYDKYYRVTGDLDALRYNLKAIDAAMAEEVGDGRWKNSGARSGICLVGYGLAYDYTGDRKYLDYGLAVLEKTTKADGTRVKTFAQQFRASPYFLTVLTQGHTPTKVLAGSAP